MKSWLWLVVGVVACTISWTYMHRVLLPWEHYINVDRGRLRAEMGDLYPRWVGTRELLLNRRNPYGPEVSQEIQIGFYGHVIVQTYDKPESEIVDEQRFVYPVYVAFLLAPTVHQDFIVLQAWAPFVLGGLIAGSVLVWMRVMGWRPPPVVAIAIALIVLSSPQIAQGLRLRQFGFFVVFLIALATWCVIRNRLVPAGALLALATIKPQMVLLGVTWFLIWTLGEWRNRWKLAASFGFAMLLLIGGGELLLPGWPRYFAEGLEAYRKYFPTTSPVRLILGNWLGGAISLLAVVGLATYAWNQRAVAQTSEQFLELTSLFLLGTTLFLPLVTPYNQALLLLPILMIIRDWRRFGRFSKAAFVAVFAWPPMIAGIFLLRPPEIRSMDRWPLLPSALLILIPFLVGWLMFARRSQSSELGIAEASSAAGSI